LGYIAHRGGTGIPATLSEKFRLEEGEEIHERDRKLFTDANRVVAINPIEAASTTAALLKDGHISCILEPANLLS
jgi:hypothetical protein